MPSIGQINPIHKFPHQFVKINDNTEYFETPSSLSGSTMMTFVAWSPKGVDRKMFTVRGGESEFLEKIGIGPYSIYGQPLLNAYNCAVSGAATINFMRVSAPDAKYANIVVLARYKEESEGKVTVKIVKEIMPELTADGNIANIWTAPLSEPDEGFTTVRLFTVKCKGRGVWGNNIAFNITSNSSADKTNDFKNYLIEVFERESGTDIKKEEYQVCFNDEAIVSSASLFADSIVNDPVSGSSCIEIDTNIDGFKQIFNVYKAVNTTSKLTFDTFDVLLGIDKTTVGKLSVEAPNRGVIPNYTLDAISEGVVVLNNTVSKPILGGGHDGAFTYNANTVEALARKTALTAAYLDAYNGTTDVSIKSKRKFPTNIILDAGFDPSIKKAIAALTKGRGDCVCVLDMENGLATKTSPFDYLSTNQLIEFTEDRTIMFDAYSGKVKDPVSKKLITVTSTYGLASGYPILFQKYEGKHIPMAGNNYGKLSTFINGTIYPIYDEDIDGDIMDQLVDNNINYAKISPKGEIVRAIQNTRQDRLSNLSEANNVFILLDIKRDCEALCAEYEYMFSEDSDIARFNSDAKVLLDKYEAAQVRSIAAAFSKNAWEAERGILHMYVEFVHKDLVKTSIIEIDVNR